jgi:PAS domain S-box-containing protein
MMLSEETIHILLVEDEHDQVRFLQTTLRIGGESPYTLTHAETLAEALKLLGVSRFDIILLDLHLPDSSGLDTPRVLLEAVTDIPVVIFSGNTDLEVAVEAVRLGAQDYLLKGEAREPLLSRAIRYAIERKRAALQLEEAHRELKEKHTALEQARGELRTERDMFVSGPTVLFRRELAPGYPISFVSRNVSQFGYLPRDLMHGDLRYETLVHEDDREGFLALLDLRIQQDVDHIEHEYRLLDARGEIVWLHEVVRVQRDSEGRAVAQLAYVVDVTQRRRAERTLADTRRRFDNLIGNIDDIVFELDEAGCFRYVSPTVKRVLGWQADELTGKPFTELLAGEQRDEWMTALRRHSGMTLFSRESPMLTSKGEERMFRITARRQGVGDAGPGLAGILTDVTDRHEMEHAIRNVRSRTQQYLDIAEVIFLSLDTGGIVRLINKKGCRVLGYHEHEIVGKNWFDLCIPEVAREEVRRYFFSIVEGSSTQPELHENAVRTRDGGQRLIRWHNALLYDDRGAVIGILSSGEDITERRRIEEEVRGTQQLIDLALWGADLGAWEWDIVTDTISLNQRAVGMLGYDATEEMSFSVLRERTLPADDLQRLTATMEEHLAGRTPFYQAETWMICRDGEWKWVLERGKVVEWDSSGAPLRMAGTYLDLTERKYAEIALEDSERKFRLLAENSSDIIWTVNADFEMTFISPSVEFVLGYTPEEMMQREFFSVLEIEFRSRNVDAFKEYMQTAASLDSTERTLRTEVPFVKKDGSILWVEVVATPVFDRAGKLISIHGNTRDIHHRKLAQDALGESEEKYRLLVENQTDLVVKIDQDGNFLFVSPSYCRLFGRSEEELLQQSFLQFVHEEDRAATHEAMQELSEAPHTVYIEQRALTREGWRWLGWQHTAVRDDDGIVVAVIGVGRDVTERRMAERALIESEKRLRTVISNLPVIMFTFDREGRFTMSEGKGLESLGLRPGEVVGDSIWELYAGHNAVLESIRRALRGEAFVHTVTLQGKSFETWYSPVLDDDGQLASVIGVAADVTERKKSEEELHQYRNHLEELVEARTLELERANERLGRFRFALDSAADNIYIIDPVTMKYVDLNDSAVTSLGHTREELLTMGPADIQSEDDEGDAMRMYARIRDGVLDVGMFETEHERKDGGRFPVEVFVRAFESGENRLLVATARDITRRRDAELALKDSESKYRNVLENANEAIIVLQDEYLRFFNYKVLELTGLSEAELRNVSIYQFVHPDDHQLVRRQYQERLRGSLLPESYDVRMYDSNGTIKWMEVRDVAIEWEGEAATLNFFNDITARRHAEDYIRFQASLLSIVRNSIVAIDLAGRITYWNSFAETMYGWEAREVQGRKLHELPTFGAEFERDLLPALKREGHWEGEVERPRRDGTLLSVYSLWNAITQDDQLQGYVGIGMDLSERKKLERELLQSQKLASLGILSEGIAHELRNPLGYASSAAQLLLTKKGLSEEELKKYSSVIHTGVDRANSIVENLLLIGKPKGQLMKKAVNLVDSVNNAVSLISAHHNAADVHIDLQIASQPLQVHGNAEMLVQLFYNLFTNALDAMAGKGTISVSGEQGDGSVRVRIADTGPGVPDAIVENIFDPFFTSTKADKGVGLGLTLCYFIMDDHEGRIELDTDVDRGAAFVLTFPSV